jgi:hypothetical protein
MIVKFKKGKHLTKAINRPRFNLFGNGSIVAKVRFTRDSVYMLDEENQKDWNKLSAGACFGFFPLVKQFQMHYNSSRWGWRYNPSIAAFELSPYFYVNGERFYAEILGIAPAVLYQDTDYYISIVPTEAGVVYTIEDVFGGVFSYVATNQVNLTKSGWTAIPYFGGTLPAPKDIEYNLEILKI